MKIVQFVRNCLRKRVKTQVQSVLHYFDHPMMRVGLNMPNRLEFDVPRDMGYHIDSITVLRGPACYDFYSDCDTTLRYPSCKERRSLEFKPTDPNKILGGFVAYAPDWHASGRLSDFDLKIRAFEYMKEEKVYQWATRDFTLRPGIEPSYCWGLVLPDEEVAVLDLRFLPSQVKYVEPQSKDSYTIIYHDAGALIHFSRPVYGVGVNVYLNQGRIQTQRTTTIEEHSRGFDLRPVTPVAIVKAMHKLTEEGVL